MKCPTCNLPFIPATYTVEFDGKTFTLSEQNCSACIVKRFPEPIKPEPQPELPGIQAAA